MWRSFRFALRYRDVEELLAERGVIVTDETIRRGCRKFGQTDANALRRRPRPGDTWHPDEVFVSVNGTQRYRRRAVDRDGHVLAILVQARRDQAAAVQFLRKLLKGLAYVPRVVSTDKHASYGAALREILPSVEHRRHKGLHNRAEHAHQPTRERRMRRFKDPGHAQRFLAAYGPIIPMPAPGPLYQARAPLPVPTAIPPGVSVRAEHGPRRCSRTTAAPGGALGRGACPRSRCQFSKRQPARGTAAPVVRADRGERHGEGQTRRAPPRGGGAGCAARAGGAARTPTAERRWRAGGETVAERAHRPENRRGQRTAAPQRR